MFAFPRTLLWIRINLSKKETKLKLKPVTERFKCLRKLNKTSNNLKKVNENLFAYKRKKSIFMKSLKDCDRSHRDHAITLIDLFLDLN